MVRLILNTTVSAVGLSVEPIKPFYEYKDLLTFTCTNGFTALYIISKKNNKVLQLPSLKNPFFTSQTTVTKAENIGFPLIYGDETYYFATNNLTNKSADFVGLTITPTYNYFKTNDKITIRGCSFTALYMIPAYETSNTPLKDPDLTVPFYNGTAGTYTFTLPAIPDGKYYVTSENFGYSSRVITFSETGILVITSEVIKPYQAGDKLTISGCLFDTLYIVITETRTVIQKVYSGSEINSYDLILPELPSGSYYITSSNYSYSSEPFTVTSVPTDISSQWSVVFDDNASLMKAGLYNENINEYHYIYNLIKPTDLSKTATNTTNTPLPPTIDDDFISSLNDRIVLTVTSSYVSYDDSKDDLGINNGVYYLQIKDGYIKINNPYISFTGDVQIESQVSEKYNMTDDDNTLTIVNIDSAEASDHNCKYIVKYDIIDIVESTDEYYYYVDIITSNDYDYIGTFPSGFPDPGWKYGEDNNNIRTNITEVATALFNDCTDVFCHRLTYEEATKVQDGKTYGIGNGEKYSASILNSTFVLRVQPAPSNPVNNLKDQTKINLQWGGNDSLTYDVVSTQYSYTNECTMVVTIPENLSADFSTPIYDVNGKKMNNLVTSKEAVFVELFIPPTIPLNIIRYTQLSDLVGKQYYVPTMIPGGDYQNVFSDKLYVKFDSSGSPTLSADRCRQPWRLSHYVRSNKTTDEQILKIAYNTAAALVYHASLNTTTDPGSLVLNVNIWDLRANSDPTYSADVVPPLLALIDALDLYEYGIEQPIKDYSYNIKTLNGEDSKDDLIERLNKVSMDVYPILDSITGGGQQLGLAGCGFICTIDFLCRDNFNVMLKYDKIKEWDVYDTINTIDTNKKVFQSEDDFQNLIHIYKMLAMRGANFDTYDNWAKNLITYSNTNKEPRSYSQSILERAYLTNLRIRNINVTIEEELLFGENFQGTQTTYTTDADGNKTPTSWSDCYLYFIDSTQASTASPNVPKSSYYETIVDTVPKVTPSYVYTDFPMTGIPDRGWGSLTVEIFSYMGIAFVGMNDYINFCKWHRAYWHLIFIQNGGDMYGWENNEIDKIKTTDSSKTNISYDDFWIPSYLSKLDDAVNGKTGPNWVNDVLNKNEELHSYDIFKYPPEKYYQNGGSWEKNKTKMWANRFRPYRGNLNETQIRWTTPSYCMGYSPAWVAGGKTVDTEGWDTNGINRPVAEALNPCFTNTSGLYSATDGDNNILQAYILASLQWQNKPDIDATNGLSSDFEQPTPPKGDASGTYGYDCDVSDFFYNTDIVGATKESEESVRKGVRYAATKFKTTRWDYNPNHLPNSGIPNSNITDKIGYGITYSYDTEQWTYPTDPENERCTTWKYIARSIQRTMISKHGNGWGSNFGNFATLKGFPSADPDGARFETLGHDSSASTGSTKLDYIDFRLYQVCETCTVSDP